MKLIFFDVRLRLRRRGARAVLRLFTVFLRAFLLRGFLRLLGAALLLTRRRRVVFLRLGLALRRVVFRLRVVFLLLGDFLRRVVFLLRVVRRLLGLALLHVVLRRRVVFLRLGLALRRVTLLADFLLAIVFLPFLFDFTLFFRLAEVFLFAALRLVFRRGFKITTSANGMRSDCPSRLPHIRAVCCYMLVSYTYRSKVGL